LVAFAIGAVSGFILRKVSRFLRHRADASADLMTVHFFRHLETWTILLITIVQVLLYGFAFYIWWSSTPVGHSSGALITAGAFAAIIIGSAIGPLMRDVMSGASMMAENWYGVGDLISIDAPKVQGVVESVSLRSTRVRGLNGQTIWVANSSISAVNVSHRGTSSIAIELFVNDVDGAEDLVEEVNKLLPTGTALLNQTLKITNVEERAEDVWHMTLIGETAPGRDWIVQETAIELLKKLDETQENDALLLADPVSRYADPETEKQFSRAVRNAKKPHRKFDYRKLTKKQIQDAKEEAQKK
ncbi:hypothetical protein B7Z28_01230, partial [Candidatus Saccharibacteria bacterium 32-45-3]